MHRKILRMDYKLSGIEFHEKRENGEKENKKAIKMNCEKSNMSL